MTDNKKKEIRKEFKKEFTYKECNCGFGISSKGIQHKEIDCPEPFIKIGEVGVKRLEDWIVALCESIRAEALKEVEKDLDIHFLNNQSALLSVGAMKEFLAKLSKEDLAPSK